MSSIVFTHTSAHLSWKLGRLREIQEAAAFVEAAIAGHMNRLSADLQEAFGSLPEAEYEARYRDSEVDIWRLGEAFPQTLRKSLFITAYSTFETDLENVCAEFIRRGNLTLRPKDLSGSGIARSQTFIKKVAQMPFPDTSREWNIISNLNTVRNVIVHRDGWVEDHPEAQKAVAALEAIRIERGELFLDQ